MNYLIHILILLGTSSYCLSKDQKEAQLEPKDQVKKVGEDVEFTCKSPPGYAVGYPNIAFLLEHEGSLILRKNAADGISEDSVSHVTFEITNLTKNATGKYKCIIDTGNGNNVSSETNLFVVEGDKKTIFVEEGKNITLKCISWTETRAGFAWFVDGKQVGDRNVEDRNTYKIENADREYALKPITCKVTFKKDNGLYNFTDTYATELQKNVSVVNVTTCTSKNQCQMKAKVYGFTPVKISWSSDDVNVVGGENMTNLTTGYFNYTGSVLLTVSGGGTIWSRNISIGDKPEQLIEDEKPIVAIAIIASLVVVTAAVILIVVFYFCYWKRRHQGANGGQGPAVPDSGEDGEVINPQEGKIGSKRLSSSMIKEESIPLKEKYFKEN